MLGRLTTTDEIIFEKGIDGNIEFISGNYEYALHFDWDLFDEHVDIRIAKDYGNNCGDQRVFKIIQHAHSISTGDYFNLAYRDFSYLRIDTEDSLDEINAFLGALPNVKLPDFLEYLDEFQYKDASIRVLTQGGKYYLEFTGSGATMMVQYMWKAASAFGYYNSKQPSMLSPMLDSIQKLNNTWEKAKEIYRKDYYNQLFEQKIVEYPMTKKDALEPLGKGIFDQITEASAEFVPYEPKKKKERVNMFDNNPGFEEYVPTVKKPEPSHLTQFGKAERRSVKKSRKKRLD